MNAESATEKRLNVGAKGQPQSRLRAKNLPKLAIANKILWSLGFLFCHLPMTKRKPRNKPLIIAFFARFCKLLLPIRKFFEGCPTRKLDIIGGLRGRSTPWLGVARNRLRRGTKSKLACWGIGRLVGTHQSFLQKSASTAATRVRQSRREPVVSSLSEGAARPLHAGGGLLYQF